MRICLWRSVHGMHAKLFVHKTCGPNGHNNNDAGHHFCYEISLPMLSEELCCCDVANDELKWLDVNVDTWKPWWDQRKHSWKQHKHLFHRANSLQDILLQWPFFFSENASSVCLDLKLEFKKILSEENADFDIALMMKIWESRHSLVEIHSLQKVFFVMLLDLQMMAWFWWGGVFIIVCLLISCRCTAKGTADAVASSSSLLYHAHPFWMSEPDNCSIKRQLGSTNNEGFPALFQGLPPRNATKWLLHLC